MKRNKLFISFVIATSLFVTACSSNGSSVSTETSVSVEVDTSVSEETVSTSIEEKVETSTETSTESTIETSVEETKEPEVEENLTLRDYVERKLGCRVGCAMAGTEIDDPKVWEIVTTHFSAVTLGNELKPDALFGYSISTVPGTETVNFNGEQLVVPKLDYSRAEKMLNKILKWNNENPDRKIMVRGHVLVWHAQTPEWFFHVDYNKNKPYVDKDTMNKRLEWYIKTVLTHFTGEGSKYAGMFYGWDVVNEAVSDSGLSIRTDKENSAESLSEDRHNNNSSWYHIYQSNEYIINAFKYANKYAPADVELYYNDYNETTPGKQTQIEKLLTAIKEAEGEPGTGTRIDAMGMQGHYGMDTPSSNSVNAAIKAYAKIVGNVQITELDISASDSYDGTPESVTAENEKLRKRYNMLYYDICGANNESYVNVTGITFWGTVDHYSWLQSRSNLGGGNTTGLPQMPLLFDQNYEPKPCFYVFAK